MKKTRILSTTLITLASILAVVFCVLMGVFLTNKTPRPNNSNPNLDAATPTGNWVDYATKPATGSGTEASPWHIKTAAELAYLSKTFTADSNFYLYLDADIDLGAHEWTPIGNSSTKINSIYLYGENYTIDNLYIDSKGYAGFIGYAENCYIKDVNFRNAQVTGYDYAGVVAGNAGGTYDNINIIAGSVKANNSLFRSVAGGIVGAGGRTIINCTNSADVNSTNTSNTAYNINSAAGGIVGSSSATITNCQNTGKIVANCKNSNTKGNASSHAGGIVGSSSATITNCINSGTAAAIGQNTYDDGIAGWHSTTSEIIDCRNIVGLWTDYAVEPAVGSGTAADPWHIYNGAELAYLTLTATSSSNIYAHLEADIDLSVHEWVPIGDASTQISSIYLYGQNYTISEMYISSTTKYVGLVGYAQYCYITDVNFKSVNIICEQTYSGVASGYVGGGYFSNIDIKSGIVKAIGTDGKRVGGIVGYIYNSSSFTIQNCTNAATITVNSILMNQNWVGGIVGYCNSSADRIIQNCTNIGNITAISSATNGYSYTGGIVGYIAGSNITIQNCINIGAVTSRCGSYNSYAGGIAGYVASVNVLVKDCTNTGSISANNTSTSSTAHNSAAGIVGYLAGSRTSIAVIQNCINTGSIGSLKDYAGGIIGYGIGLSVTVNSCYNSGTVTGYLYVGGIVGYGGTTNCNMIINECYNSGVVKTTYTYGTARGLIGYCNRGTFTINNCVFRGELIADSIKSSTGSSNEIFVRRNNNTITYASCYYSAVHKTSESDAGTNYKKYILGTDTESTAFSSDVWVVNSSTEMSSLPVPKSLMWVGDYLENNQNILQFLKTNGFTAGSVNAM